MQVRPDESVLITIDTHTDPHVGPTLFNAAAHGPAPNRLIATLARLPLQESLPDPHLPAPLRAVMVQSDCWID